MYSLGRDTGGQREAPPPPRHSLRREDLPAWHGATPKERECGAEDRSEVLLLSCASEPLEGDLDVVVGMDQAEGELGGRRLYAEGGHLQGGIAACPEGGFIDALHANGHLDLVGFAGDGEFANAVELEWSLGGFRGRCEG